MKRLIQFFIMMVSLFIIFLSPAPTQSESSQADHQMGSMIKSQMPAPNSRTRALSPDNLSSDDTSLPSKDVVDLSSWNAWMTQGDYYQLKAQGVKTVVVKLSEGAYYQNPYAASQIQMARNAGLNIAVYHFAAYGTGPTDPAVEGQYFANTAKALGLPSSTVMILDVENPSYGGDQTAAAIMFANSVRANGYSTVRYYTSQSWVSSGIMNASVLGAENMWIAQYLYGKPSYQNLQNTQYGAWQYTSQMYFTNFSSHQPLDVSVDYKDLFNAPISPGSIAYQTQVQNIGWQPAMHNGEVAGTTGQNLRMESIAIALQNLPAGVSGSVEYQAHVQNYGWMPAQRDGNIAGTVGQSLRMEAIAVALKGSIADTYYVKYRVHVQNYGWMPWTTDGNIAGTTGQALRIEAIQIQLVKK